MLPPLSNRFRQPNSSTLAIQLLRSEYDYSARQLANDQLTHPSFSWQSFLAFGREQKILPLLYSKLQGWDEVPEQVIAELRKESSRNGMINSLILKELRQVLEAFAQAGIEVLVMKGAALLMSVYQIKSSRPMTDVDLLVHIHDMDRAKAIMLSHGWHVAVEPSLPYEFYNALMFGKEDLYPLPSNFTIEVHSSLFFLPHILSARQMEWFWQSPRQVEKEGWSISIFRPEAQLLHLCAHLWLHHQGGELMGMYDIYELIRQAGNTLDWADVLQAARQMDFLIPLQKTLSELAEDWQANIPPEVLSRLVRMQPSKREQRSFGQYFDENSDYGPLLAASMLSFPDWPTRLRFAWAFLFPPASYMRWHYQIRAGWLLPVYYLYRPLSRLVQQAKK